MRIQLPGIALFLLLAWLPASISARQTLPPAPQMMPPQQAPIPPASPGLPAQPLAPVQPPPGSPSIPPVTIGAPQPVPSAPQEPLQPLSILQPREPPLESVMPAAPPAPPPSSPASAVLWPTGILPPGVELVDGIFFLGFGAEAIKPTARVNIQGQVVEKNGQVINIQVPSQTINFDWTVEPSVLLGLRIPNNNGQFTFYYGFFNSSTNGKTFDIDGGWNVQNKLNFNQFNLDYTTGLLDLGFPGLGLKGMFGGKVSSVYFTTTTTNSRETRTVTNYFLGVGPEGALELDYTFSRLPAWTLYGRVDGSVLVGQIQQGFTLQYASGAPSAFNGNEKLKRTESVPTTNAELGVRYTPQFLKELQFTLGYQFEEYFWLGKINPSHLDLNLQGAFLRVQYEF